MMASWAALQKYPNLAAVTLLLVAQSPTAQADMIDKSGMAPWEVCALCHGADGISVMAKFPKLAGQKAAYIEGQFLQFRNGERVNDGGQMQAVSTEVELSAFSEIFEYFSELPAPQAVPSAAEDLQNNSSLATQIERGRALFYHGEKDIPACGSCHADAASNAPWIDGQHQAYLAKQLTDFRHGQRRAKDMEVIAARLSESDIVALSLFLAGERLPRK